MNTTPNKPAGQSPAAQQAQQTSQQAPSNPPTKTEGGGTQVADPKAQQVHQPISAVDQGAIGNTAQTPGTASGNQGGGDNATATPGASPVVSTDGAKQAVAHAGNERDVSQGSPAKGGGGLIHPVTGGATQEHRLRGHELLQIAAQRFGLNIANGVTEFFWDAAANDLVVKHSPGPNAGVQATTGPGNSAPEA